MPLTDRQIKERVLSQNMIEPFTDRLVRHDEDGNRIVSYGLSSAGYDARLAATGGYYTAYKVGVPWTDLDEIDPLKPETIERSYTKLYPGQGSFLVPPGGAVLVETVEYFRIPEDIICIVFAKSTYARFFLDCLVTPLEPGWEGTITVEITNNGSRPVRMHTGHGLCQILFLQLDEIPEVTYADRAGKYMHQRGVTLPKV